MTLSTYLTLCGYPNRVLTVATISALDYETFESMLLINGFTDHFEKIGCHVFFLNELPMEHTELTVKTLGLKSYFLLSMEEKLKILSWRNHPSVRNVFIQQREIDEATHLNFIESLKGDESRRYWMVSHNKAHIGSLDLYRVTERDCFWGYFLAPHFQKSALGLLVEYAVMEVVFDRMSLKSLQCETLVHNEGVLKIHRQFGFKETQRTEGRVFMSIDNNDWKIRKSELEVFIELLLR